MSRVDEIRKRLEAATPGPWHKALPAGGLYVMTDGGAMVAEIRGYGANLHQEENLAFIAAAPEDTSYLLGRVEKLEGLLTEAETAICDALNAAETHSTQDVQAMRDWLVARTLLADESEENEHGSK